MHELSSSRQREESERPLWVESGRSGRIAKNSSWQHARLCRTAGVGQKQPFKSSPSHSSVRKTMRFALIALTLICPLTAMANGQSDSFPSGTVALLERELPRMNKAVAEKDRTYFGPALQRVQEFLSSWEGRQGGDVLEMNKTCTDAATDFLIVGLCKISPPGSICEPTTFFPKTERNIQQCRALATPAIGSAIK